MIGSSAEGEEDAGVQHSLGPAQFGSSMVWDQRCSFVGEDTLDNGLISGGREHVNLSFRHF